MVVLLAIIDVMCHSSMTTAMMVMGSGDNVNKDRDDNDKDRDDDDTTAMDTIDPTI